MNDTGVDAWNIANGKLPTVPPIQEVPSIDEYDEEPAQLDTGDPKMDVLCDLLGLGTDEGADENILYIEDHIYDHVINEDGDTHTYLVLDPSELEEMMDERMDDRASQIVDELPEGVEPYFNRSEWIDDQQPDAGDELATYDGREIEVTHIESDENYYIYRLA